MFDGYGRALENVAARSGGLALEGVRVSGAGFPNRRTALRPFRLFGVVSPIVSIASWNSCSARLKRAAAAAFLNDFGDFGSVFHAAFNRVLRSSDELDARCRINSRAAFRSSSIIVILSIAASSVNAASTAWFSAKLSRRLKGESWFGIILG